jgi:hypothetical protein
MAETKSSKVRAFIRAQEKDVPLTAKERKTLSHIMTYYIAMPGGAVTSLYVILQYALMDMFK